MEKPNWSPKRPHKHSKNRRKQQQHQQPPLKIVYITNPIRFKASASEFRALVQELTGQGAVYPSEYVAGGEASASASASASAAAESDNAHAVEVATKIGRESESDPAEVGSGTGDGFYGVEMVENLQGMNLIRDVLKSFDGI